jgi:hypothetical protein
MGTRIQRFLYLFKTSLVSHFVAGPIMRKAVDSVEFCNTVEILTTRKDKGLEPNNRLFTISHNVHAKFGVNKLNGVLSHG